MRARGATPNTASPERRWEAFGGTTETERRKDFDAGGAARRGHRYLRCARERKQSQRRSAVHGSGVAGRRLLARQQRQGLSARSEHEREGLRGPRQRERQRGSLPLDDDDSKH